MMINVILLGSIASPAIFSYMQKKIKKEVKKSILAGIPEEDLSIIRLSDIQMQDVRIFSYVEAHEFLYYGKMYDIVRSTKVGDTTIFHCIYDDKETKLVERFSDLAKGVKDKYGRVLNNMMDNLLKVKVIYKAFTLYYEFLTEKHFTIRLYTPLNTYLDVPVPPPKLF